MSWKVFEERIGAVLMLARRPVPPGFVFAAKVPQVITHEKMLVDCEKDLKHFLGTMDELREKLGPLLFSVRILQ